MRGTPMMTVKGMQMQRPEEVSGMELVRTRVIVAGRVQGVYFRASTRQVAERLSLSGWVRNLHDGRVEAVFEGEPSRVDEALEWVRVGPAGAAVRSVDVTREDPLGEQGFAIRYED